MFSLVLYPPINYPRLQVLEPRVQRPQKKTVSVNAKYVNNYNYSTPSSTLDLSDTW